MITSTGSHIEIPVTISGDGSYDASKNEYDFSENGYLSVSDEMIRGGDLTISMMYAMKSGNEYGNDQLVNFSDSNSFNRASDSTDLHIFRDGTTPGAWLYYGASGMAISEAGLQSVVEFDSTDLQMEYIANITAAERTWTSVYTNNGETATTHETSVPSGWTKNSDGDGDFYLTGNKKVMTPNYPNKSHVLDIDDKAGASARGITYEAWIKNSSDSAPFDGYGWLMGMETNWGPFLTLDDHRIGGIGMWPDSVDDPPDTYRGLTHPGYITDTDKIDQLLHVVGYLYMKPDASGGFTRGVWINGTHYPQETAREGYPQLETEVEPFSIGGRNNDHRIVT